MLDLKGGGSPRRSPARFRRSSGSSRRTNVGWATGNFPEVEEERNTVGSRAGVVVAGESEDPGSVAKIDSNLRGDAHLVKATVELGEVAVQVVGVSVRHPKLSASETARSCSLVVIV